MSKESPFLSNKKTDLVHPSTKIIFGEPSKRPRPVTSKVNSTYRKAIMQSKRANLAQVERPPPKNAFTAFTNCSQSPEKQRLINFYFSAGSFNNVKKKIDKCRYSELF